MVQTTMSRTKADEKSAVRAEINACFAEMDRLHATMKDDQVEIDRLQTEISSNLATVDAFLAKWAAA